MEKTITKEKKPKKVQEQIEYWTDELHKNIFPFQEGYKNSYGGKPFMKTISIVRTKK